MCADDVVAAAVAEAPGVLLLVFCFLFFFARDFAVVVAAVVEGLVSAAFAILRWCAIIFRSPSRLSSRRARLVLVLDILLNTKL